MGNQKRSAAIVDGHGAGLRGVAVVCERSAPCGAREPGVERAGSPAAARYRLGSKPEPVSSPGTSDSGVATCGGGCANPWMTHRPLGPISA